MTTIFCSGSDERGVARDNVWCRECEWGVVMTLAANMGGRLRGFVKPIHRKYRDQKVEFFLRLVRGRGKRGRLLDVGGGPGVDGEYQELYATFDEVVVLNVERAKFRTPPGVKLKTMAGDARELPLESSSFDWVFSNAVIT